MSKIELIRVRIKALDVMKGIINIFIQASKEMNELSIIKPAREYLTKINMKKLEANEALKIDPHSKDYGVTMDILINELHLIEEEGALLITRKRGN